MHDLKKIILAATVMALAAISCGGSGDQTPTPQKTKSEKSSASSTGVPKGDRILELDANSPEHNDYDRVMDLARELGAESIRLSVYWDDLETSPGVYNPEPNWLAIANSYYPSRDFQISLVISILDTTEVRLPADLEGKPLNDPEVITRFEGLLSYIAQQTPDLELTSLAIGNEIDGVLGSDAEAWEAYNQFFTAAAAEARLLWPDVPVSAKVMLEGLTGKSREYARSLNNSADVIMTTYYPLAGDFRVLDPGIIHDDFDQLADLYPDREIHITEIGYPTSEVNKSSPDLQAEFVREMFAAWDDHADQITLISYSWLSDLPESSVRELEGYYGLSNKAFGEFLRTLGLRTYPGSGEDKPGFQTFRDEAAARGW